MAEGRPPSAQERARGHSTPDVNVRLIVGSGLVLAAIFAAILGGAFALHAWRADGADDRFGPAVSGATVRAFPEPRLQPGRTEERKHYFAEQRARAAEYGWIDREHGIVRIPIERAMHLLAEEQAGSQQRGVERR